MSETIDARGLSCPQPVILAKKALEKYADILVIVDNTTALENIQRLGASNGCNIDIKDSGGGTFKIRLRAGSDKAARSAREDFSCMADQDKSCSGPSVIVLSSEQMGRGNDELGTVLMKSFLHTLTESETIPATIILYNTGVKLAVKGSAVIDDLKKLEEKGVKILVCGTCVNYFNVKNDISAGVISNMYDISGSMLTSGRLLIP